MTDNLLVLEVEEEDWKLGIRQPTFDIEGGILTVPIIAPDKFTLLPIYRWDRDKDWMGNLEALKTRLIIQLQDEFEDSVFNLILTKLTSIINKNKDALAVAVEKIKTVVEEYSQPKFKFEFKIPDGLKAENIHISLDGKAVHIRVKDQVISCGIKNNVQAILEDFGSKFAALYDDVDLSSLITLCLSENLDRFNHELREYEELKSEQPSHQERLINPSELDAISDRKYDDYVIGAIQKTVKLEPRLIRQIFTTAVSTYTPNPINLGIIAPTSEGKTHPVIETLEYFPNSDVWYIGSMSPKTLIRLNGLLVDSNNSPIGDKVKE